MPLTKSDWEFDAEMLLRGALPVLVMHSPVRTENPWRDPASSKALSLGGNTVLASLEQAAERRAIGKTGYKIIMPDGPDIEQIIYFKPEASELAKRVRDHLHQLAQTGTPLMTPEQHDSVLNLREHHWACEQSFPVYMFFDMMAPLVQHSRRHCAERGVQFKPGSLVL